MEKNTIAVGSKVLGYRKIMSDIAIPGSLASAEKVNGSYLMSRADNGKTIQVRFVVAVADKKPTGRKKGVINPVSAAIRTMTLAGKTRKEIFVHLKATYGEKKYRIGYDIMKAKMSVAEAH